MKLPALLRSTREFRASFVRGLGKLLMEDELGTLILVLANASTDPGIGRILRLRLSARFVAFEAEFRDQLQPELVYPTDDLAVFRQLLRVGFANIGATRYRKCGDFEVQYNPIRSFRPARAASKKRLGLHQPFDARGFHFNKPFLRKEILWQGKLLGRDCRLLYNKFPFAELHGLLVVDAEEQRPQWLREADHHFIWSLTGVLGRGMQGVGFAYNASGAFASINHQHFQMYVRDGGRYPVEHAHWRHRGGSQPYPLNCRYFDDARLAWEAVQALHRSGRSYNLLYRPGGMYLLPRRVQGSYRHASWTQGFAWAEVAGSVTAFNEPDYERLTAGDIRNELGKLDLSDSHW